jgi:hypothetical protein
MQRLPVLVAHACNVCNSGGSQFKARPIAKIRLVEWLKVKALSSSPSIAKKKKKRRCKDIPGIF